MGVDPLRFHLIAPYSDDPQLYLSLDWVDRYSGAAFLVTTSDDRLAIADCWLAVPCVKGREPSSGRSPTESRKWRWVIGSGLMT